MNMKMLKIAYDDLGGVVFWIMWGIAVLAWLVGLACLFAPFPVVNLLPLGVAIAYTWMAYLTLNDIYG